LDRHELVLCLAHGGGCLPGVSPRLDLGWERKDVARSSELAPSTYLQRLLYDTALFSTTALRRLIEDVSSANVLLGTDSPFDLEDRTPLETIEALGLTGRESDEIRSLNALRLIPRLAAAFPSDVSEPVEPSHS
ncbi:MAG TPA: amidohydrolase family protein, partial [Marmoricola sp.]|nr:amidohydrolase family protein [Marmoricola sp.]